jgi:hypothetical protein
VNARLGMPAAGIPTSVSESRHRFNMAFVLLSIGI